MVDRALRLLVVLSLMKGLSVLLGPGTAIVHSQQTTTRLAFNYEAWLRYEDSNYGFIIRYPPDWFLDPTTRSEGGDVATVSNHPISEATGEPNKSVQSLFAKVEVGVFLHDKPSGQSLEEWSRPTGWMLPLLVEQNTLVINGVHAVQQIYQHGEALVSTTYIPKGTKVYFVTITVLHSDFTPEVLAILQSFTFSIPYERTQEIVEYLYPQDSYGPPGSIPPMSPAGFRLPFDGSYAISNGPGEEFHNGPAEEAIDFPMNMGTPIMATEVGNVTFADWDGSGYGLSVQLHHDNGMDSWYAHLSEIQVSFDQRPAKGQQIALSGNTGGNSTGPHLHFHVNSGSDPVCLRDLSDVWWNEWFPPGNPDFYSGCACYPPCGSPPGQCYQGARDLSCGAPLPPCPQSGGVILYKHTFGWEPNECGGEGDGYGYVILSQGLHNLPDTFNDKASSIRVPYPLSVKLYEQSIEQGLGGCILLDTENWNFEDDYFHNNHPVNDQISAYQLFTDMCPAPCGAVGESPAGLNGVCGSRCPGPSLAEPPNGYISFSRTIIFQWNDVDCTHNGFTFRVKTVPDMEVGGQTIVDTGEGGTQRTETFSSQWDNQDLYWSVRAANAPAGADWAPSQQFRISPNAPPSISFDTAHGDPFPSGRIESQERNWVFQGTASDPEDHLNRVEYNCFGDNCGSYHTHSGLHNWTYERHNLEGRNDIYFRAYDDENNSTASRHLDLNIDLASPTTGHNLAGTMGENGWYVSPVEVHLHADDGCTMNACAGVQEIRYRLDSGAWQTHGDSDKYFTVGSDGIHTIEYYAVDEVGNTESQKQTTFKIDATPPTAPGATTETHGVVSGQWQKDWNDPDFTWDPASDATSGLAYYRVHWQDTLHVRADPAYDPPEVGTGSYSLSVEAVDQAGNVGPEGAYFIFNYDGTPPHAPDIQNNDGVASGVWQNQIRTANFSWPTPQDLGSGIAGYYVYWGPDPDGTSDILTPDNTFVDPTPICGEDEAATHYLRVRSEDNVGWTSEWVDFALRYDGAPPTATLIANYGLTVTHQTNVHLDIIGQDEGSGVFQMNLSNDGRNWYGWWDYLEEIYWEIPDIGRRFHPIYLRLADKVGNVSAVVSDAVYLDVNVPRPRSDNFWLWNYTTPAGGLESTSTNYMLRDTVGQSLDSPESVSLNYTVYNGYQAGALAEPTLTPTYTTYFQMGYVVASGGTGAETLQSTDYQMYSTLGQPAEMITITSPSYILLTGFWGGAGTDAPPPPPPPEPEPPEPPECEAYSIVINDDAPFTYSPAVTLTLCGPDAVDVMLSNDSSFDGATWQPYTTTLPWILDVQGSSIQTRFVYARFRDSSEAIHGDFFDQIVYDPNAPQGEVAFDLVNLLPPTSTLELESKPQRVVREKTAELFVSALDDSSGLAEMQLSFSPVFSGAEWQPYSAITPITFTIDGTNTVYVRFRDYASNISGSASDSLVVDTTPPTGTAVVLDEIVGPRTISITLGLSAMDNTTGVEEVRISALESFTNTLWQSYVPLIAVPVSYTGEVQPMLYIQFRDGAGNASQTYTATYAVDTTPPVLYVGVVPGDTLTRTVTILAYDDLTGLGQMWLSNDPLMLDGVETMPYTHTITWTFDERQVVWVQLADGIGNISEPYPAYSGTELEVGHEVYLPLVVKNK